MQPYAQPYSNETSAPASRPACVEEVREMVLARLEIQLKRRNHVIN